jgi:hypothetical protein
MDDIYDIANSQATNLTGEDVTNILECIENNSNPFFNNKTTKMVIEEIQQVLNSNTVNDVEKVSEKLISYRYIDEVNEVLRGRHVKWVNISKSPKKLKGGGIVLNIKFLDNGVHILCSQGNRITQYKFDECLTFQKLTDQEQLILMANEYIDK